MVILNKIIDGWLERHKTMKISVKFLLYSTNRQTVMVILICRRSQIKI